MLRVVRSSAFCVLTCAVFVSAPSPVRAQLSTRGLVARWTFDDGTGKDSAGANDMTLVGSPAVVASPMGSALEVRSTAYAVASSPDLNVNGWTGLTVSVWVQPVTSFTTYGNILGRGSDSSGGAYIFYAPGVNQWDSLFNVNFSVTQVEGAVFHNFSPSKPPYPVLGNWYHLVGTYDGQTIRTYVNGVLDGSTTVSTPGRALWEPAGCKTYIGTSYALPYRNWGDQYFSGVFDDVAIWQRALTPVEITQLFLANTQQVSFAAANPRGNVPTSSARRYNPGAKPPPPAERVAPPRDNTPRLVSYSYDSKTAKGILSVDIANAGIEARDWVIKNIGKIASSKELLLEAGKEPTDGGRYKVLNESLKDGILTVEFEVLH